MNIVETSMTVRMEQVDSVQKVANKILLLVEIIRVNAFFVEENSNLEEH